MKENPKYTVEWSQKRNILRCASILPDDGLPVDTFLMAIDSEYQYMARQMMKHGTLTLNNGRILPNAVVKYNVRVRFGEISGFISPLYFMLKDRVDAYITKPTYTTQDKLWNILSWQKDLSGLELNVMERDALAVTGSRIRDINMVSISEEDTKKIDQLHNFLWLLYCRHFRSQKEQRMKQFHQSSGNPVCKILLHVVDTAESTPAFVKEMFLELIGTYYDLEPIGMWKESVSVTERLISLLKESHAEAWEIGYAYMDLSNRVLMTFREDDDYLSKSFHYLSMAQEYLNQDDKDKQGEKPGLRIVK